MIQVFFFARFREELGVESEQLEIEFLSCVGDLLDCLQHRGDTWGRLFAEDQRVMMAVNQAVADRKTPLGEGDEVALFPPVTGG
ncbi:MAG: molybdopterin converting factor subunit 1 [Candidatus Thiodiazotropha sp. (ex Lucinoma aequizonata)]|nr:molybdopterin converting factor subunit 1 [Candidatus Thiodiazotropha sp. (ex Lucinoma aequizonata)]MCU7889731.1 molybdopterin converting factor subunit 1 [Candidatus Thiodiazotropha sp. (ex Lucinoma aequizonata)]MCU7895789.1 molybdopterin converting factor subunit 1 [Candidatus Thiodiazotropha sp. (ex Lucinoma aequizonata)]MCU7899566.1 molybdopterin converting factor subunit 1 [Candidatus Thiodiazotropha sp. (ex Lucinoma aequizonata)]MCU7901529.1 molybdopterin converting factor subunit 1 [C